MRTLQHPGRAGLTLAVAGVLSVAPATAALAHAGDDTATSVDAAAATTSSGSAVLDFARAQIGEPYAYGAEGPNAWDCSGLTQAAFAAAGISIPRTSAGQAQVGRQVSDPRPGDLVVYPGHVGIYAGDGQLVDASNPSRPVLERDVWGDPTYRRVA